MGTLVAVGTPTGRGSAGGGTERREGKQRRTIAARPGKPDHRFVIWMLCVFVGFPNLKLANVQFVEAFMLLHMLYLIMGVALRGGPEEKPRGLWIKPGVGYGIAMFLVLAFGFLSLRLRVFPPMYGPFFIHMRMLPVVARWIELALVVFYGVYAAELMRRDGRLRDYGMKVYMWAGVASGWMTFLGYLTYGFLKLSITTNGPEHRGQGGFPEGGPWGLYLVTVSIVARMLWVRGKLTKTQALVIALTLAGAFLSSKSKAAAICALVMLLVNIFFSNNVRQKVISIVGLVLVGAVAWFVFDVPTIWNIGLKLQKSAEIIVRMNPRDPNLAYGRVAGSVIVPRMIAEHPITGIGFGNYPVMRNDPVYLGIMWPDRYYDLPGVGLLAVAAELGLPVLALLYGMMLYTVWRARRTRAHRLVFTLAMCQPLVHIFGAQITLFYPWLASGIALCLMPIGEVPRAVKERRWLRWLEQEHRLRPRALVLPKLPRREVIFNQLLAVARQKRLVLGVTLAFLVLSAAYALMTPRMYESEVVVLPSQEKPLLGMGGSMLDFSKAMSSNAGVTFKTSEDFWTAVMKQRTVGNLVVKNQNLQAVYKKKTESAARGELESRTRFVVDRAGLIGVRVKDPDPKRAAAIATGYVDALHEVMVNMALADAASRKKFFGQAVDEEKASLKRAEDGFEAVEKRTGVILLGGQASAGVERIGSLQGKIIAANVELKSLLMRATEENANVQRLRAQIAGDESELEKLQTENDAKPGIGNVGVAAIPAATRDYMDAAREVQYHQWALAELEKELEGADLDEARSAGQLQVVDVAIPADRPTGLPRSAIVLMGTALGFLFGAIAALLRERWRSRKALIQGGGMDGGGTGAGWKMDAFRAALREQE